MKKLPIGAIIALAPFALFQLFVIACAFKNFGGGTMGEDGVYYGSFPEAVYSASTLAHIVSLLPMAAYWKVMSDMANRKYFFTPLIGFLQLALLILQPVIAMGVLF
jgi:hypothetical protein